MNQLKHLMGIPITLPNGLALRGSTFSRSAGTNGRSPKRSNKLLVVTADDDELNEPKLSSKSYAKIIEEYSKAIEARNAAAKLHGESKANKNRGFFSKPPFQRLARVSSMVNIKNNSNNGGSNLCTESSSRPTNTIKTNNKTHRSKSGFDSRGIPDEATKQAEWLDHVVKAHNVKKTTKNYNFDDDRDYEKSEAHNLVERLPESRVTRNSTTNSFNDSCNSTGKAFSATPANDLNNTSKLPNGVDKISTKAKEENGISKIESNTRVEKNFHGKKLQDNSAIVVDDISSKAENTISKNVSNTSVRKNSPAKKLQNNSTSDTIKTPKKITSTSTITKSISHTSVQKNLLGEKVQVNPKKELIKTPKKSTSASTITKSTSNTSIDHNSSVKKLPAYSKNDASNICKRTKKKNTIAKITSSTNINKKMPDKKSPGNPTRDVNYTMKKTKPANTITKITSDTSIRDKISAKKVPDNLSSDVNNVSKRSKIGSTISKSMSDENVNHTLSAKKLPGNLVRDVNITSSKPSTSRKTNFKNCNSPVDRYCSSLERTARPSTSHLKTAKNSKIASNLKTPTNLKTAANLKIAANLKTTPNVVRSSKKTDKTLAHNSSVDTEVVSSKSNATKNLNQKSVNNSVDRTYSSLEKESEPTKSDIKNISVIVQRLPKVEKSRDQQKQSNQDANMMLVTVKENSKSSSATKSFPLRHIDLRINGKPATEVDNVISKVDKLGVVSSAEKIEITIPILSKDEGAIGDDNLRAPNSTINLCISTQANESTGLNDVEYKKSNERINSGLGRSKSCLSRPPRIASTMKNVRRTGSSTYRSKVIPWWTNVDSFRRSEVVSRTTKGTPNTTNFVVKPSPVEQSPDCVNSEVNDGKPKKVAFNDVRKTPNIVVLKPSDSSIKQHLYRRKRASVLSKVIANEEQKKLEREEQERLVRKQLTLERLKSYAKPEPKNDNRVKSTASNLTKNEQKSVNIDSSMSGKTIQSTPDSVSGKKASTPKSNVSGVKTITVEIESDKKLEITRNNNFSNPKNFNGRMRNEPISTVIKGKLSASKNRKAKSARQNSDSKPVSKIGAKLRQEVIGKTDTNASPQLPRTYGKVRLLPTTQTLAKPGNRESLEISQSSEPVKPSETTTITDDKVSKVKNSTITIKPIEKKKDGTLIDYGVTVNTRKKPERKLSGLESTGGLQGKKFIKQKDTAVVATVKEVMPRRNRDSRSSTINPQAAIDSSRSRIHALDENLRKPSESQTSPAKPEDSASKVTTNEQNVSVNLKESVTSEKNDFKNSNEKSTPVIETASAADKKLVYSVWLRRFKERTDQEPDSTKDPSSRRP